MSNPDKFHPRAEALLAYADDLLDSELTAEIEKLISQDSSARAFLQQMQLSDLPYRNAFEPLLDISATGFNNPLQKNVIEPTPFLWRNTLVSQPVQLAAALLIGLGLSFMYQQSTTVDRSNWMVQVAEYQQLYVRQTLQTKPLNRSQIEQLQSRLSRALGAQFVIPDLSKFQLDFIRGQILQVNAQPLIQLVYLPPEGKPIAFCITPKQFAVSEPRADTARGLEMVHWNNLENSFVLMGDHPSNQLMKMALAAQTQIEEVVPSSG